MTHTYQISGMHCQSCIVKVKNELLKLGDITEAQIQLEYPQATITMQKHIGTPVLNNAVSKAGKFILSDTVTGNMYEASGTEDSRSWFHVYKPLITVVAFITLVSFFSSFMHGKWMAMLWMQHFMAGFFITFSFFKFLDLKGFANSYSSYDLLARKWYGYGYVYPFIELFLGLAYLISWQPVITNIATVSVMSFSTIGVLQAVMNKKRIQCACLGAVFKLPMSTVTIVEDLVMAGMALFSLITLL